MPGISFLAELRELYPEAKVVLVTRDPAGWWRSLGVLNKNVNPWYLSYLTAPVPGWRWIPAMIREYADSGRELLGMRPDENDAGDRGPGKCNKFLLLFNIAPRVGKQPRVKAACMTDGYQDLILNHNQSVRDQVPRDQLLEMDLKEGWEPLSKFLGRPVPDAPFPRANDKEALEKVAGEVFAKCVLAWLTIISGAGVGLYTGIRLWRRL